jgi:hypothetical protein
MPEGGRRNDYEQRQGGHRSQVPCPYLTLGGSGRKYSWSPAYAISRKGNENYFEAQPRIRASLISSERWDAVLNKITRLRVEFVCIVECKPARWPAAVIVL